MVPMPQLTYNSDGLIPAVAQDADTHEVLMMAWMDEEALRRTLATGKATYWSRSRREYWVKGETSGHHQAVVSVAADCDGDTGRRAPRATPATAPASSRS